MRDRGGDGERVPAPSPRQRRGLGGGAAAQRCGAGGAAVPEGAVRGDGGASADRLWLGTSRAAEAGRDAAAALERVRAERPRSRALPVQPVLRAVHGVAVEAGPGDAPGAPRRREGVHRLLGQEADHHRCPDRRGARSRAVRDGARREQLHVCRVDADPEGRGLHRLGDTRARLLRWRARGAGARPTP